MTSFHERQKSLFDHLNAAEKQAMNILSNTESMVENNETRFDRRTARKLKGEMKQFRGKESIFKRPEAPLKNCLKTGKLPDHRKNPHKWVYYNLDDVTVDDMSDRKNAATAFAFMKELEERQQQHDEMVVDGDKNIEESKEVTFKKPTFCISATLKSKTQRKDEHEKLKEFKSGKVFMPEYVVGVSGKKERKSKEPKQKEAARGVELKLHHLLENEFEDE